MKLESQVCSLEQAKRLRELGIYPGLTFFRWQYTEFFSTVLEPVDHTAFIVSKNYVSTSDKTVFYPAPTVAELGCIMYDYVLPHYSQVFKQWSVHVLSIGHDTEAKMRAESLIYLLEEGFITAAECNSRLLNS